jgi:hypothetical protein
MSATNGSHVAPPGKRKKMTKSTIKLLFCIGLIVAIIGGTVTFQVTRRHNIVANGETAIGEVQGAYFKTSTGNRNRVQVYRIVYEFTVDGEQYFVNSTENYKNPEQAKGAIEQDEDVEVKYPKDNPYDAIVVD